VAKIIVIALLLGVPIFLLPIVIAIELFHWKQQTIKRPLLKCMLTGLYLSFLAIPIVSILSFTNLLGSGEAGFAGMFMAFFMSFGALIAGFLVGIPYEYYGKTLLAWKRERAENRKISNQAL